MLYVHLHLPQIRELRVEMDTLEAAKAEALSSQRSLKQV